MTIEAMEVNTKALEKRETIEREINSVQAIATSIVITNNNGYREAGELLVTIKKVKKTIEEYFKPLKEAAHKSWKQLCDRENQETAKLTPALDHLNKQMTVWNIEQDRLRKAEEERLRQEAFKREEDDRLAAALQAEQEGNKEEAIAILEEPVFVPSPIVESSVPKISGQTMTTTWKWRLKDINLVPRQYLTTNDIAINQVVRALKDKSNIPGIEPYEVSSMRGVRL